MAAIDIIGAGGGITNVTGTSPVVVTVVGVTGRNVSLDQSQFKTINGNSIFGTGNIVIATGLTNWTEAFNSGTQATSSFTATNAATNVNAALVPKGTGAVLAQIPTGTTVGGNARGTYSVDFQMDRNNANQVASGNYSAIVSGVNSRVSGNLGFSGAGASSVISGNNSAVIVGTSNTVSGTSSSIVSGQSNTISANDSFLGGGNLNNVTGIYSAIGGGQSNTSSGQWGFIGSGNANVSSGNYSAISGGQNNTASGPYTGISGGLRTVAYMHGQIAHASGRFSIDGDAQGSETILRLNDGFTNSQTKEIYLDGSSLRITGPTNSAMTVNIDIVAIVTAISGTATGVTVGDMFSQNEICAYKNIGGTGTVVGSHSIHNLHDASMSGCDTAFATTGAALQVFFNGPNFSGGGTVTLRIVAKARIVETRY